MACVNPQRGNNNYYGDDDNNNNLMTSDLNSMEVLTYTYLS